MKRINQHVGLASGVMISNIWLLDTPAGRLLVDCGHPLERPALMMQLWKAGIRRRGDLLGVLLTHRHSDHSGNAAWLRKKFDCPIFAHEADAPFLTGEAIAPKLLKQTTSLGARLLCHIEDRFPARTVIDDVFSGGSWRWDLQIFPTPGHTEGSALLFHESTQTLFSGDSLLAGIAVLRPFEVMGFARPDFSDDHDQSRQIVQAAITQLPRIEMLCSGHGPAITKSADAKIRKLLDR